MTDMNIVDMNAIDMNRGRQPRHPARDPGHAAVRRAEELLAAGRLPNLARVLPSTGWERRHTPGSSPSPRTPRSSPDSCRRRSGRDAIPALRGEVRRQRDHRGDDVGLRRARPRQGTGIGRLHTACVGGVGFFNPESRLGTVLPGYFAESHWSPDFGVTARDSFENQIDQVEKTSPGWPRTGCSSSSSTSRRSTSPTGSTSTAPSQRRRHPRLARGGLEYLDWQIWRLLTVMASRRPCFVILCSDHGTAYGEDGHIGHRIGHEVVWRSPTRTSSSNKQGLLSTRDSTY